MKPTGAGLSTSMRLAFTFQHAFIEPFHRFDLAYVPAVGYLIGARGRLGTTHARTPGNSGLSRLYRMYEYLVRGFMHGFVWEIMSFFRTQWAVSDIPNPHDPNTERYAIVACLTAHLVDAIEFMKQQGFSRHRKAVSDSDLEDDIHWTSSAEEREPPWARHVPELEYELVIPAPDGTPPRTEFLHQRFRHMNILIERQFLPYTLNHLGIIGD